jgi:maltooligosyltrehalose trehalohydrolase
MDRVYEEGSLGALVTTGGVRFRVWAPSARSVTLVLENNSRSEVELQPEADGYFSVTVPDIGRRTLYRYRLDGRGPYPDPCSRFQPAGPHGPSMVVDSNAYAWHDGGWPGIEMKGQVIYEMHIGAFTREGTFDAAIRHLAELRDLGVSALEIMPIAEFPGRWNWGYDGVNLYAPYHGYGDPDAFKRFVDAAHRHHLAVVLDVIYNHVGPDGNFLGCYSRDYFTDRYRNDWGEALNFDGPNAQAVREYFIGNACYWIREFHLDGLRLDATQSMHDASQPHVIAELSQRVRAAALPRKIILIAENEPQRSEYLNPIAAGGFGLDALWNDDFHHAARVALTGRHEGYYHDYRGHAQEFVSAVKRGFLYQGQYYDWQRQPRGAPFTSQPAWSLITFIQNHDQVGNTLYGERLHELTSPGRYRAITALLLLAPQTPLLFMGQEFAASQPFAFFADHRPELAVVVHAGRREFLSQFTTYATPSAQQKVPDPAAESTFLASKLDLSERDEHASVYALHKDLLRLRREDPVIAAQARERIDGAVLSAHAFVLRWFDAEQGDRLLVVNLGSELELHPIPEPLLAPPLRSQWQMIWSSDEPRYDGPGALNPNTEERWLLPGESAVLLEAR